MFHLLPPHSRQITVVFVIFIVLLEIYNRYFHAVPAYLRASKWKSLLIFIGGTLAAALCLTPADAFLLREVQAQDSELRTTLVSIGTWLAKNIWFVLILVYLFSALSRRKHVPHMIFSALLANVIGALLSTICKFSFARARPEAELGPLSFFNWDKVRYGEFQSFSSGDVALVASVFGFFFFALKNLPARVLFFVLPLFTCYARVALNRHWPSDALLSLGVGFAAAYWVAGYYRWTCVSGPAAASQ